MVGFLFGIIAGHYLAVAFMEGEPMKGVVAVCFFLIGGILQGVIRRLPKQD